MDAVPFLGRAHYVVDVWVDVDLAEMSVDRVTVDMAGLAGPIDLTRRGGELLGPAERQALLNVLEADPWPSWDYDGRLLPASRSRISRSVSHMLGQALHELGITLATRSHGSCEILLGNFLVARHRPSVPA